MSTGAQALPDAQAVQKHLGLQSGRGVLLDISCPAWLPPRPYLSPSQPKSYCGGVGRKEKINSENSLRCELLKEKD